MIRKEDIRINNRFQLTLDKTKIVVNEENITILLSQTHMFEGIPLTPEFITSQGVEKDPMSKNVYRTGKLELVDRGEFFFVYYDKVKLKEIKYVHEFQGLIYELIQNVSK